MPPAMVSLEEEYAREIMKAASSAIGQFDSVEEITTRVKSAVAIAQREFLHEHSDYSSCGPIRVTLDQSGCMGVSAPICTIGSQIEERNRQKAARDLVEWEHQREIDRAKREAEMLRRHKKLMVKYANAIPPSTASIWDSLTTGQQYAILKDIDYSARHACQP